MQVAILAGGRATRMGAVAERTPKFLLEVAGAPFADHQLRWLASQDVERVTLCVAHLGPQIRDFVGDGSRWGLEVAYIDDGDRLRGTGGALRLAAAEGALEPSFGVLYGDSWLDFSIREAWRAFERSGRSMLMCVLRNQGRWDASNAAVAGGLVSRYEKGLKDPAGAGLDHIDYGFSIVSRDPMIEALGSAEPTDLADAYTRLASHGEVTAHEVSERFYEIGSVTGLEELDAHLRSGQ